MEMANPDKRAEYQVNEEQEAYVETQEASDPNHPKCPRCTTWHHTVSYRLVDAIFPWYEDILLPCPAASHSDGLSPV